MFLDCVSLCIFLDSEHLIKPYSINFILLPERVACQWFSVQACSCCMTVELWLLLPGQLVEARTSLICEVISLADRFGLDQLVALCEKVLKHSVDSENVCFILERIALIENCGNTETANFMTRVR